MRYNGSLVLTNTQLARRRALLTLLATILGALIFNQAHLSSVMQFSLACAYLGISLFIRGRTRSFLYFIGILLLAGGWFQLRTRQVSIHRLDQVIAAHHDDVGNHTRIPIEIIGVISEPLREITTDPQPGDPPTWATPKTQTLVHVEQVYLTDQDQRGTWTNANGRLRVLLPDGYLELFDKTQLQEQIKPGDRVQLIGMYRMPSSARNIGEPDWSMLSAQSGRVGTLIIPNQALIEPVAYTDFFARSKGMFIRFRSQLQVRAMRSLGLDSAELGKAVSPQQAMLGALLLGHREPAFGEVYESFKRIGVAHVLAISGFHLALVIMIGAFGIRIIGEHPRAELVIVLTILVLGVLVIPLRPPIVRAGVIVVLMMLAGRSGRRYDRMTVLAWVGVGLLIWRPMDVFSLGYQLSMGISALLVMLADPLPTKNPTAVIANQIAARGVAHQSKRWFCDALKTNFACWAVAAPTIVYHAGIVSIFAPLVAVVLIPLVMILMIVGYGQIAIGVVSPDLGTHSAIIVNAIADAVLGSIQWIDGIPGSSVRVGGRNGITGVTGMLWVVACTWIIGALVTHRVELKNRWIQGAGIILASWFFVGPVILQERSVLRLDMLDVGDGTCVLLQSDGQALLWDCGSLNRRVGGMTGDVAHALGVSNIKDAVVTHDNLDHFNGLIDLTPRVGLERVWISKRMVDDPSWAWQQTAERLESMSVQLIEIRNGTNIQVGNSSLSCLWPDPDSIDGMGDNDTSVVMRVDIDVQLKPYTRTVLLTGDIESDAIDALLNRNPQLKVDIIEVPHHGSAKESAMDLIALLNPQVVLQSTGASRLNDVRWETLRAQQDWYATAERGGIWVRILRDGTIEHGWAVDH